MKLIFLTIAIVAMFSSCNSGSKSKDDTLPAGVHKVVVQEVIQAGSYTYLRVLEKEKEMWLAVNSMEATKDQTLYYKGGFEMIDFKSKELNKTFKSIYFIDKISTTLESETNIPNKQAFESHGSKVEVSKIDKKIEPVAGGTTIAALFEKKKSFNGKSVKVKGKVMKFSEGIMSKNWIHLQDGTEFSGKFDLTVTTDTIVRVGDIITIEGKIILDKDFGYGYFYELMIENAKLIAK